MIRDTSIAAFNGIKPTLSDRQSAVLALLERSHALTDKEIARELGWEINTVTPRRGELEKYGLVQSYGKRRCRVSGSKKEVHVWGVAKDGPKPEAPAAKMVMMPVVIDGVRMVRPVRENTN